VKEKNTNIISNNKTFVWIALATVLILLIPWALTIRDGNVKGVGWNWTWPGDYIFGFTMILGFSSLFVLAARKFPKRRLLLGIAILITFLLIWVHLAVGIVDSWPLAGS
jgi:hypothetical protein